MTRRERGSAALLIFVEPTPYVLGLVRLLAERRPVEVLFLAADVSQPWRLSLDGLPASVLPRNPVAAAALIRARLASGRFGILHLAGWGYTAMLAALILARRRGIPVFMESDTPLPARSPLWKRALKRLLYPALFRVPRMLLPGGKRQADYFRHYGVTDDRIKNVNMTVDVAGIMRRGAAERGPTERAELRREFGLSEGATVFLFVGRLEERKGLAVLLEAFEGLSAARSGAALLIVGDGEQRELAEKAATRNRGVRYAGRLDGERVIRALHCADAVVVPSLLEPWGLVVNEAMAAGLPAIVADRVGCVDDLVRDGTTGVVVPAGSSGALLRAMLRLADDPALRASMGAAALREISGWTLEHQARNIASAWGAAS